jgi:hypothetical protein
MLYNTNRRKKRFQFEHILTNLPKSPIRGFSLFSIESKSRNIPGSGFDEAHHSFYILSFWTHLNLYVRSRTEKKVARVIGSVDYLRSPMSTYRRVIRHGRLFS